MKGHVRRDGISAKMMDDLESNMCIYWNLLIICNTCMYVCVHVFQGMQENFEMFSKLMEEQLSEQRKKFEEQLKKREMVRRD